MNPLRRRSDRWQGATAVAALLIVLSAVPVAIILAAATWRHQILTHDKEATMWRHTTVTVLEVARRTAEPGGVATVGWRDERGVARQGGTSLAGGLPVGQTMKLWTDGDGRLAFAPLSHADVVIDTTGAALTVMTVAALAGFILYRGVKHRLDATRYRGIDAEWQQFNEARAPEGQS